MDKQTILITGATDGIGRGTAMELARKGATVLLHGRDAARLEATRDEITAATGGAPPDIYLADFASLDEVRRLAAEIGAAHPVLDVLINNAGIGRGAEGGRVRESAPTDTSFAFRSTIWRRCCCPVWCSTTCAAPRRGASSTLPRRAKWRSTSTTR